MLFSNVFHSEVIHNEAEGNGASFVGEEAGDSFGLVVAVLGKVGDENIIGNASRLREAVHAFVDFNVDIAIANDVLERSADEVELGGRLEE